MAKKLTYFILAGLVLGILVGWALNANSEAVRRAPAWGWLGDDKTAAQMLTAIGAAFSIVTTIFLHLIKMIIAPLVFSTLVVGIAHMGDTAALGRVGVKALGWFICASLVSLTLGLILVNLLQPGVGVGLPLPPADAGERRRPGRLRSRALRHAHLPEIDDRRDGEQRDPADRRLLAVPRRRDHRGRRAGQAAGPGDRGAGRR